MRLARFGETGCERPGIFDRNGVLRDLSAIIADIDASTLSTDMFAYLRNMDLEDLPRAPADCRFGPCVGGIGKVIGVGMNYYDHLTRTGRPVPEIPTLFAKPTSSICGPNDAILLPPRSEGLDWEVELGVLIGTKTFNVEREAALGAIAGYCIVNDITERNWIARSGQIFDGKCGDTFTPIGPWLVTADEIEAPGNLSLSLELCGKTMQTGNTSDMIFDLATLLSHISSLTTLMPGDLITTGTPAGIGALQKPSTYLEAGDEMRLFITGLGEQRQRVELHPDALLSRRA